MLLKEAFELGIGSIFGSYSGIITSLGLILGMYGGKLQKRAYVIALLSLSMGDSFSDAFGIYNATEQSWEQAIQAFISKFTYPLLMIIPFLLTNVKNAVFINILFGSIVLANVSYKLLGTIGGMISNVTITWLVIVFIYFISGLIEKIKI
jgi:hypothetical protein